MYNSINFRAVISNIDSSYIRTVLKSLVFHLPFFLIVNPLPIFIQQSSQYTQKCVIHQQPGKEKSSLQSSNPSLILIYNRLNLGSDMWTYCAFKSYHFM